MKKAFLSLTLLALALSANTTFARNVSLQEAKTAAACYMNTVSGKDKVNPSDVVLVHQIDNPVLNVPACYFFNISNWGWVIISGSTTIDPIVAYNDNCRTLDMETAPENMMMWLEGFASIISARQIKDSEEGMDDDKAWAELFEETDTPKNGAKTPFILMGEEWDQGDNGGTTYNIYCPKHQGTSCVTGCVATALSQIIHYYKFPVVGQGYHSYFWCNTELGMSSPGTALRLRFDTMYFNYSLMPNVINSNTTTAQKREISRLCYAVGVAMDMNYGTSASGGSGAQSAAVPGNMNAYFKYRRCTQIRRTSTYSNPSVSGGVDDSTFMAQIRYELMLNRPIYMSGASSSHGGNDDRHAWVCSGYKDNSTKQYYMNWGWSGSGNGWFNLYDNTTTNAPQGMHITTPGLNYTFILEQTAMIGLIPPHPDSSNVDFWDHLGIANTDTPELLDAYPNPATFNVTIPYSIKTPQLMSIYNVEGKLVEQHMLQPANNNIVVDVTAMPAGIYIYRVGGASGKFNVMK